MGKDVVRKFSLIAFTLVDVQEGQKPFAELLPRTIHVKGRMDRDSFLNYLTELERSTSSRRAALLLKPAAGMFLFIYLFICWKK